MRSYKQVLEWLGGVAIVASLLLVAYEIRENTNAVSAQAFYDLNQSGSDLLRSIAMDPDFARLWQIGDETPDALDDLQWIQYQSAVWADLNMYEAAYIFYEKGIIDSSEYAVSISSYCLERHLPGWQRVLETVPARFMEAFFASADRFCEAGQ